MENKNKSYILLIYERIQEQTSYMVSSGCGLLLFVNKLFVHMVFLVENLRTQSQNYSYEDKVKRYLSLIYEHKTIKLGI